MVRSVTEFVEDPIVMIICDHMSCSTIHVTQLDVNDRNGSVNEAARIASAAGWGIDLTGQVCPGHMAVHQDRKRLIVMPSPSLLMQ